MKLNDSVYNLTEYINEKNISKPIILLTAVSYENRGIKSIKKIIEKFDIEKTILILFGTEYLDKSLSKKWQKQKTEIINFLEKKEIEIIKINSDPVYFNNSINTISSHINKVNFNIINISTFPKNYILRFSKEFHNVNSIFYYYRTNYREPSKKELSIPIKDIIPIKGFEGKRELESDDLLVLILGCEGNRALSFLSKFSPYKILPIISIPSMGDEQIDNIFYENVKKYNSKLLHKHSVIKREGSTFHTISSIDHIKFYKELDQILSKYIKKDIDISISPLGTKPQTLGLYLYWKEHPEIQIIYSAPVKRFDYTDVDLKEGEGKFKFEKLNDEEKPLIYTLSN